MKKLTWLDKIILVLVGVAVGMLISSMVSCASGALQADKADYPNLVVTGKWISFIEYAKSFSLTIIKETETGGYIYRPVYCKTIYHEGVYIYDKVNVWKDDEHGCYLEALR